MDPASEVQKLKILYDNITVELYVYIYKRWSLLFHVEQISGIKATSLYGTGQYYVLQK